MPPNNGSLARLLAVLDVLAAPGADPMRGMSLTEIAHAVDRDKSTVSRQLQNLVDLGVVERDADHLHRLGWRFFAIAVRSGNQRLIASGRPIVRRLGRALDERVHLSVRMHDEVLTVLTEGPAHVVRAAGWVGRTVPLVNTSSGRALLFNTDDDEVRDIVEAYRQSAPSAGVTPTADDVITHLHAARRAGYAVVHDEFEEGLSAVAAPVTEPGGAVIAAINISGPSYRLAPALERSTSLVVQAARQLSDALAPPSTADSSVRRRASVRQPERGDAGV